MPKKVTYYLVIEWGDNNEERDINLSKTLYIYDNLEQISLKHNIIMQNLKKIVPGFVKGVYKNCKYFEFLKHYDVVRIQSDRVFLYEKAVRDAIYTHLHPERRRTKSHHPSII